MFTNKLLIISILLLAGCSTTSPTVKIVTQRVEVPVAVPCKETAPIVPDYCFSKLSDTLDIFDKTKCLLSDRELSLGYEIELLAKFKACK